MAKTFTDAYNEDQAQGSPIGDNLTGNEILGFDPSTGSTSYGVKLSQIVTWLKNTALSGYYYLVGDTIPITDGGTGATNTVDARTNLVQDFPVGTFVTTSTRNLVVADAWTTIVMNVATANDLVIPANSAEAFPVDSEICIIQYGVGTTSVLISTDTLTKDPALSVNLNGKGAVAGIKKVTATEWILFGNLAPL